MSLHEYKMSQLLEKEDVPFYALIMAAMRKADSDNVDKLKKTFPKTWTELDFRYHARGGKLEGE